MFSALAGPCIQTIITVGVYTCVWEEENTSKTRIHTHTLSDYCDFLRMLGKAE